MSLPKSIGQIIFDCINGNNPDFFDCFYALASQIKSGDNKGKIVYEETYVGISDKLGNYFYIRELDGSGKLIEKKRRSSCSPQYTLDRKYRIVIVWHNNRLCCKDDKSICKSNILSNIICCLCGCDCTFQSAILEDKFKLFTEETLKDECKVSKEIDFMSVDFTCPEELHCCIKSLC